MQDDNAGGGGGMRAWALLPALGVAAAGGWSGQALRAAHAVLCAVSAVQPLCAARRAVDEPPPLVVHSQQLGLGL